MMQSRTHNCNQLRIENVGEKVKLVGWMENVREVGGNLAFVVLRDFYGTTQVVVEDEGIPIALGRSALTVFSRESSAEIACRNIARRLTGERVPLMKLPRR